MFYISLGSVDDDNDMDFTKFKGGQTILDICNKMEFEHQIEVSIFKDEFDFDWFEFWWLFLKNMAKEIKVFSSEWVVNLI